MRRGGGSYPLWVGLGACALFTALLWPSEGQRSPEAPLAADAGAADAAAPPPAASGLVWNVEGRPVPGARVLAACLAELGVTGLDELTITWRQVLQSLVPRDGWLALSTRVDGHCHLAAALHVATASCLAVEGAALVDPLLGRRYGAGDWPRPGPGGGLDLPALVDVGGAPARSRGLTRFGLRELEGDDPRAVQEAAARSIVACETVQVGTIAPPPPRPRERAPREPRPAPAAREPRRPAPPPASKPAPPRLPPPTFDYR